jgi:hypothetical protein
MTAGFEVELTPQRDMQKRQVANICGPIVCTSSFTDKLGYWIGSRIVLSIISNCKSCRVSSKDPKLELKCESYEKVQAKFF